LEKVGSLTSIRERSQKKGIYLEGKSKNQALQKWKGEAEYGRLILGRETKTLGQQEGKQREEGS